MIKNYHVMYTKLFVYNMFVIIVFLMLIGAIAYGWNGLGFFDVMFHKITMRLYCLYILSFSVLCLTDTIDGSKPYINKY